LKLRFLSPARNELAEAVRFYNQQSAGLGDDFRDEAWHALTRINAFPDAWHLLGGRIRRCLLRRFPYGLIYEASREEILVIAVAHLHRRPEYWRARIP
jgi:toxin ParE2